MPDWILFALMMANGGLLMVGVWLSRRRKRSDAYYNSGEAHLMSEKDYWAKQKGG